MEQSHFIQTDIDTDDPAFLYLELHPDEKITYLIRHHWAGFLPTLLIVAAMFLMPLLAGLIINLAVPHFFDAMTPMFALFATIYYLFIETFLFTSWINYYFNIIIITNQRMINVAQEGLLSRKTSELNFAEIENVSADVNGLFQVAFNFGLLVVETAGGGTSGAMLKPGFFTVQDVPDPNRIARAILDLKLNASDQKDGGE